MDAQAKLNQIRKALKENGEVTLSLQGYGDMTISSISEMPKYGNPPDQPDLVEVWDCINRRGWRFDLSKIIS